MIIDNIERLPGETDAELISRVTGLKNKYKWSEITDTLNMLLGKNVGTDSYRKNKCSSHVPNQKYNSFKNINLSSEEYLEMKNTLEQMKIQLRDERRSMSKQNYTDARFNEVLELLEERFDDFAKVNFKDPKLKTDCICENSMIVCLSDLHIGQTFCNYFGEYNTDIAKQRMEEYLFKVIEIGKLNNIKNVYVSLLGDLISNALHKTIEVSNKENVIDQMKIAIELITSFIYKICENFENVYMVSVSGNHSRLQAKDLAQHSERLDAFIAWDICKSLKYVKNFKSIEECNFDDGIAVVDVCGKSYAMVHGDFDATSINGYMKLSNLIGMMPDYVLCGHKHYCMYNQNTKFVQSGSLAGAGDDYTVEKRLNGDPSQMVIICDDNGIKATYPVVLK